MSGIRLDSFKSLRYLSDPNIAIDLNLSVAEFDINGPRTVALSTILSVNHGSCHGIALWYKVAMDIEASVQFSTGPNILGEKDCNWRQLVILIEDGDDSIIRLRPNDEIKIKLTFDITYGFFVEII